MADHAGWTNCRIAGLRNLADDVREFLIAPEQALPRWTPGSHVPVRLATPHGPLTRTYSLLAGGGGQPYRIAVKRAAISRGGSAAMWALSLGDALQAASPRNGFPLLPPTSFTLLVAGGIGVTPIAGMALTLAGMGGGNRSGAGPAFRMIHAARHRGALILHDELRAVLGDRLQAAISGETGHIDFHAEFAALPEDAVVYLCGPHSMIDAARRAWATLGRTPESFRFETFGTASGATNKGFRVHIPRLGRDIAVAADESLLDALERAGIAMIADCRKGECGLCALSVLSSETPIDHRDVFFSAAEKNSGTKLCTCVSRVPGGTIVLDTADRAPPAPGRAPP